MTDETYHFGLKKNVRVTTLADVESILADREARGTPKESLEMLRRWWLIRLGLSVSGPFKEIES